MEVGWWVAIGWRTPKYGEVRRLPRKSQRHSGRDPAAPASPGQHPGVPPGEDNWLMTLVGENWWVAIG